MSEQIQVPPSLQTRKHTTTINNDCNDNDNADAYIHIPSQSPSSQSQSPPDTLKDYNLHAWEPDPCRSDDENYMDIVMFITRSSHLRQGSMGCIIVNPNLNLHANTNINTNTITSANTNTNTDHVHAYADTFYNAIMAASTNQPLFQPNDSDIHAEIATLGKCNQLQLQNEHQCMIATDNGNGNGTGATCRTGTGTGTRGCTIYITMPPCKRCFGAIVASGIARIVSGSGRGYTDPIQDCALSRGIELVSMTREFLEEQKDRISALINSGQGRGNGNGNGNGINKGDGDGEEAGARVDEVTKKVVEERKRRKDAKKRRKQNRKEVMDRNKLQKIE